METKIEGKTLAELRHEVGISQKELADMVIGATRTGIAQLERGDVGLNSAQSHRVVAKLAELGADVEQLDPAKQERIRMEEAIGHGIWVEDGYSKTTPKRTLRDWRTVRNLTMSDLAKLAHLAIRTVENVEYGTHPVVRPQTRQRLAKALRVDPSKLLLAGDEMPTESEVRIEDHLRAELRSARRQLHKCYDFMVHDPNITFRAQDTRDALLRDIQRELDLHH